jgi:hypothetical protein
MLSLTKIKKLLSSIILLSCCSHSIALSKDNHSVSEADPFHTGNFMLPESQQPGALVSFGQNVIAKNQKQIYLQADDYIGIRRHAIDLTPGIVYGITDNFSVFFNATYAANYQVNDRHSSGFEDIFVQLEYAFYNHQGKNYVDQATIVTSLSLPTGAPLYIPPTGYGSPSLFLGATFDRMYPDWFFFTSHGVTLTTEHNGTRFGNDALYQFGVGRNILNIDSRLTFACEAELDGEYAQRNVVRGVTDQGSGGNVVYLTPSLWLSSKKWIIQFGVGVPVTQNLYGDQTRNTYLLISNFGWTL